MAQTAAKYHEKTSYDRSSMGGHYLDWQNQPSVFKTYDGLKTISMSRGVPLPRKDFFSLYDDLPKSGIEHFAFDLELLSKMLLLTCTVTRKARHADGGFYFRSVASAGALYPTEIYLHSSGVKDLEDGLYHFSILEHSLVKLRDGDLSDALKRFMTACKTENCPLTFFLTAIFFRSAWKYRNRAYRYHLLDTGHVLAILELAVKALKLPFEITLDFDDRVVNQLLGLDENREVALAVCRLKGTPDSHRASEPKAIDDLPDKMKKASQVSPQEFQTPEIQAIHVAGYDIMPGNADLNMCDTLGVFAESRVAVPPTSKTVERLPYPEAVFRRRSSRNFIAETLPVSAMGALLGVIEPVDENGMDAYFQSICTGFLTNGVESFENGFYVMNEKATGVGFVKPGAFTKTMSHICLNQEWMANASLHFLFMTNMASLEKSWGPRGYRYAMMAAGILGERLYLAASALGLGCCGIGAFYDGEASRLLGLNAWSRVLYIVSLGIVKSMPGRDHLE
jgi:SagB-type dehydrogenase family enzyme